MGGTARVEVATSRTRAARLGWLNRDRDDRQAEDAEEEDAEAEEEDAKEEEEDAE